MQKCFLLIPYYLQIQYAACKPWGFLRNEPGTKFPVSKKYMILKLEEIKGLYKTKHSYQ